LHQVIGFPNSLVIHIDACRGLEIVVNQVFPRVEYLEKDHPKLWARSKFNEICKVDYENNNLPESFNAWIRKLKGLHLVDMLDKIS
jgi:hypothetical protein